MQRRMKNILTSLTTLVALAALPGCGADHANGAPFAGTSTVDIVKRGPGGTTRFLARNLYYRLDPNIAMYLTDMNADVVLKDPSLPFVPANKTDYSIQIHHAIVDKDPDSLQALMNNYVFNDADSPLKGLTISFVGETINMKGKMKKLGVWTPFEMSGTMSPTADGLICLTPTVIKSAGLRVDGLLNFLGIEMSALMKTKESKGVMVRGNQLLMDPARLYPPPTLLGRITAVGVRNGRLHIEFDDGRAQPWPTDLFLPNVKSCVCMWGGDVLINAALNLDAKMQIIDSTPATPMVFALDKYREQLEAGFVVPTKSGGMIAYAPDINNFTADLGRYSPPFPVVDIKVPAPDQGLTNAERPGTPPGGVQAAGH